MTSVSFFLMFMMMLAGGPEGPQDMLDMVPTEVYWQSKGITPSIEQLEKDAGPVQGEGSKARRLMAIRTLGEVKVAAAVPTLKLLVEAKEPFVAEYAKRAIAQIEGKPVAVAAKKSIADDLALLPKDVGIVGQFRGMSGVTVALEQLVPVIRAQIEEHEYMRSMVGELPDDKKFTSLLTGKVVEWVETVGNVRVDGMTLAVAEDVGNQSGWAMMIFRGKGDRAAFVAALKKTGRVEDEKEEEQGEQNIRRYRPLMKATQDEGIDIIELGEHMVYIMPSDEVMIMLTGPSSEKFKDVKEAVLAAIKGKKGELEKNEQIGALMSKVDLKGPVWAVGKLNAEVQNVPLFASVDTFTLTSKQGKDSVSFMVSAQGAGGGDAEKLKASAEMMTGFVQAGMEAMKPRAEKVKELGAVVELLESLKVVADGNTATMSGEVKPSIVYFVAGTSGLPWMLVHELRSNKESQPEEKVAPEVAP